LDIEPSPASPVTPVSLGHAAEMLLDSWKERLQLHRQADVPADLKPARHGNGWSTQLALQNLNTILSRNREHDVRVRMHSFYDLAGTAPDRKNVLSALRTTQIELVNHIKIFGGICIEPTWEKLKKLFDSGGVHGSWEGEDIKQDAATVRKLSKNLRLRPRLRLQEFGLRSTP